MTDLDPQTAIVLDDIAGPEATPVSGLSPIGVGGDSSGGTMAIAVCAAAAERTGPRPVQIMLWYPGTAGGPETESMERPSQGYFLDSGMMKRSMDHYLNGPEGLADPRVAPPRMTDFGILPPTCLTTAGYDPRRDDNVLIAEALARAGIRAEFHSIPDTIHGFMFMPGGIDLAVRAARDGAAYLRAAFARQ